MNSAAVINNIPYSNSFAKSFINSKTLKLLFVFFFAVFINYYSPQIFRQVTFIIFLILLFKTKDNPFWIAFFWLVVWAPAYLFNNSDPRFNLNFISVPGFPREFFYFEFVIIVALIKALRKNRVIKYKIHPLLLIIIFYSIFLFLVTLHYGIDPIKILRTIRFIIPFTLLYSLPVLLPTKEKFLEVFNYFLFFSIIVFILQIFVFATGKHFFTILGGSITSNPELLKDASNFENELIRPLYSTHILMINIITGIYYLIIKEKDGHSIPNNVPFYIFLSWFSLIISGTRGYAIAATLMIVLFLLFLSKTFIKNVKYVITFFLALLGAIFIPAVREQLSLALERILTVSLLLGGDVTAGGTLKRVSLYMPIIEEKIAQSPIFGFGYSDTFFLFTNAHIGNHNILLNGGFIGLFIFLLLIAYLIFKPYSLLKKNRDYSLAAISIGTLGFFVVHSTSFSVFSYLIGQNNYSAFLLFVSFAFVFLSESKKKNKLLKP